MNKTAFITGISGQDGSYLAKLLLEKGYHVVGGERRNASGNLWRLKRLGIEDSIEISDFELSEFTNIYRNIDKYKPDEFYNLAAQSFVASSFEMPTMTADITAVGVSRVLEAIKQINPKIKFYQASSSEMFGKVTTTPQNESTPFHPRSPYAVSKLFGHWMTVNYRESYKMFACSGILFNHESPLRGEQFVTRKITLGLSNILKNNQEYLELGNLDSKRDWGYAKDYVQGMWLMMQYDYPEDWVLATGVTKTVRDFAEEAFKYVNLNWEDYVQTDEAYHRPAEVDLLLGDPAKAREQLGWEPGTTFEDLVKLMVDEDLKLVGQGR